MRVKCHEGEKRGESRIDSSSMVHPFFGNPRQLSIFDLFDDFWGEVGYALSSTLWCETQVREFILVSIFRKTCSELIQLGLMESSKLAEDALATALAESHYYRTEALEKLSFSQLMEQFLAHFPVVTHDKPFFGALNRICLWRNILSHSSSQFPGEHFLKHTPNHPNRLARIKAFIGEREAGIYASPVDGKFETVTVDRRTPQVIFRDVAILDTICFPKLAEALGVDYKPMENWADIDSRFEHWQKFIGWQPGRTFMWAVLDKYEQDKNESS